MVLPYRLCNNPYTFQDIYQYRNTKQTRDANLFIIFPFGVSVTEINWRFAMDI